MPKFKVAGCKDVPHVELRLVDNGDGSATLRAKCAGLPGFHEYALLVFQKDGKVRALGDLPKDLGLDLTSSNALRITEL